jgi:hypothetical protein
MTKSVSKTKYKINETLVKKILKLDFSHSEFVIKISFSLRSMQFLSSVLYSVVLFSKKEINSFAIITYQRSINNLYDIKALLFIL